MTRDPRMTARIVRLRPPPAPAPTSRQLADRLLQWHAELITGIEANDKSADDFERKATAWEEAAARSSEEAAFYRIREPETHQALLGIAARYTLSARVYRARSRELRA